MPLECSSGNSKFCNGLFTNSQNRPNVRRNSRKGPCATGCRRARSSGGALSLLLSVSWTSFYMKAATEVFPAVVVGPLVELLKRLFYIVLPARVNDESLTLAPASDRRAVAH